ncbi:MAG: hypothetical protein QJR09_00005, partial [Micrococcus sp.]|nr:hypothetical protein [Micrococcus sp.]
GVKFQPSLRGQISTVVDTVQMPSRARLSNASWGFVMFDLFPPALRRFFGMGVLLAVVLGVYSSATWPGLPPEDHHGSSAAGQLDSSPIEAPELAPTADFSIGHVRIESHD